MWITDFLRKVVRTLFPKAGIEKALGRQIAVSEKMQAAIQLWDDMYKDVPNWKDENCKTMNLPSAIAHEFARLITLENEINVSGSPFADYLNEQLQYALKDFNNTVEMFCAKGGIAMKPYVNGDRIEVDFTQAESFFPTDYANKKITGAIFLDTYRSQKYLYTRLEIHSFKENQTLRTDDGELIQTNIYTVENRCYRSEPLMTYTSDDSAQVNANEPFKQEVPLSEVPQWATLERMVTIQDVEKPLFVYVRVPAANNVDTKSPLGASVYARAVDAIKDADKQYTETRFEYEAFEAAIDADEDLFKRTKDGKPILPTGKERVFRSYETRMQDGSNTFLREFAPAFRDSSLFNGLDHYLKIVEFLCELAYGTISDPSSVEKTATEIMTSKQRSYSAVSNMQAALEEGITDLVYAMSVYANLYGLAPYGNYELSATWGDGVLEDSDREFQRRWAMVVAGKYKPEKFYAWYFGCTEEEAKEMIPENQGLLPEFE